MLRDTNAEILRLHGDYLSRRSRRQFMRNARARAGVTSNIPIGVTNAPDLTRSPSPGLWGDCPWANIVSSPAFGSYVWDDFNPAGALAYAGTAQVGTFGQWSAYVGSAVTVSDAVEEGGVLKVAGSANTSGSGQFILTSSNGCFRMVGQNTFGSPTTYPYSGGKFWMEFRVAVSTIATGQLGVFLGLSDQPTTRITAAGGASVMALTGNTLTTTNNILGLFLKETVGNDFGVVYQPAGGTAVYPTGLQTLVTTVTGSAMTAYAAGSTSALANSVGVGQGTGFVKIGMVFDPAQAVPFLTAPTSPPSGQLAGVKYRPTITFYVNGVKCSQFLNPGILQASTFPNNCVFSPVVSFCAASGGSFNAAGYLDWVRMAQLPMF